MELLIAITILVGTFILATLETLLIPFLVLLATSVVLSAVFEWLFPAVPDVDEPEPDWDAIAADIADEPIFGEGVQHG